MSKMGVSGRARARKRVYGPSVGVKTCSRKMFKGKDASVYSALVHQEDMLPQP